MSPFVLFLAPLGAVECHSTSRTLLCTGRLTPPAVTSSIHDRPSFCADLQLTCRVSGARKHIFSSRAISRYYTGFHTASRTALSRASQPNAVLNLQYAFVRLASFLDRTVAGILEFISAANPDKVTHSFGAVETLLQRHAFIASFENLIYSFFLEFDNKCKIIQWRSRGVPTLRIFVAGERQIYSGI